MEDELRGNGLLYSSYSACLSFHLDLGVKMPAAPGLDSGLPSNTSVIYLRWDA